MRSAFSYLQDLNFRGDLKAVLKRCASSEWQRQPVTFGSLMRACFGPVPCLLSGCYWPAFNGNVPGLQFA
jgi:hypothetical protein